MGAPATLLKQIARFRAELAGALGSVETVVLFGSQASGRAGPESDVDLIVVSEAFQGMSYVARAAKAHHVWKLPYPVDFLCYTPAEFERLRKQVSIVRMALDEGVEVGA